MTFGGNDIVATEPVAAERLANRTLARNCLQYPSYLQILLKGLRIGNIATVALLVIGKKKKIQARSGASGMMSWLSSGRWGVVGHCSSSEGSLHAWADLYMLGIYYRYE